MSLKADLVVVSDIHLTSMEDMRGQLLLDFIAAISRGKVEHFLLLGDIFDFCLGSKKYFQEKFFALGQALEGLARQGTKITFFEGNHEFWIDKLPWDGVEFVPDGSLILQLPGGLRIKFSHGDLIYANLSYRLFRGLVKAQFTKQFATHLVPAKLLDWYSLKHAHISRRTNTYRSLNHDQLLKNANVWLDQDDCSHGIFGHYHTPYGEDRKDKEGKIISLASWDQPNALVCRGGEFYRLDLPKGLDRMDLEIVKTWF